jgi:hypothetical protein
LKRKPLQNITIHQLLFFSDPAKLLNLLAQSRPANTLASRLPASAFGPAR